MLRYTLRRPSLASGLPAGMFLLFAFLTLFSLCEVGKAIKLGTFELGTAKFPREYKGQNVEELASKGLLENAICSPLYTTIDESSIQYADAGVVGILFGIPSRFDVSDDKSIGYHGAYVLTDTSGQSKICATPILYSAVNNGYADEVIASKDIPEHCRSNLEDTDSPMSYEQQGAYSSLRPTPLLSQESHSSSVSGPSQQPHSPDNQGAASNSEEKGEGVSSSGQFVLLNMLLDGRFAEFNVMNMAALVNESPSKPSLYCTNFTPSDEFMLYIPSVGIRRVSDVNINFNVESYISVKRDDGVSTIRPVAVVNPVQRNADHVSLLPRWRGSRLGINYGVYENEWSRDPGSSDDMESNNSSPEYEPPSPYTDRLETEEHDSGSEVLSIVFEDSDLELLENQMRPLDIGMLSGSEESISRTLEDSPSVNDVVTSITIPSNPQGLSDTDTDSNASTTGSTLTRYLSDNNSSGDSNDAPNSQHSHPSITDGGNVPPSSSHQPLVVRLVSVNGLQRSPSVIALPYFRRLPSRIQTSNLAPSSRNVQTPSTENESLTLQDDVNYTHINQDRFSHHAPIPSDVSLLNPIVARMDSQGNTISYTSGSYDVDSSISYSSLEDPCMEFTGNYHGMTNGHLSFLKCPSYYSVFSDNMVEYFLKYASMYDVRKFLLSLPDCEGDTLEASRENVEFLCLRAFLSFADCDVEEHLLRDYAAPQKILDEVLSRSKAPQLYVMDVLRSYLSPIDPEGNKGEVRAKAKESILFHEWLDFINKPEIRCQLDVEPNNESGIKDVFSSDYLRRRKEFIELENAQSLAVNYMFKNPHFDNFFETHWNNLIASGGYNKFDSNILMEMSQTMRGTIIYIFGGFRLRILLNDEAFYYDMEQGSVFTPSDHGELRDILGSDISVAEKIQAVQKLPDDLQVYFIENIIGLDQALEIFICLVAGLEQCTPTMLYSMLSFETLVDAFLMEEFLVDDINYFAFKEGVPEWLSDFANSTFKHPIEGEDELSYSYNGRLLEIERKFDGGGVRLPMNIHAEPLLGVPLPTLNIGGRIVTGEVTPSPPQFTVEYEDTSWGTPIAQRERYLVQDSDDEDSNLSQLPSNEAATSQNEDSSVLEATHQRVSMHSEHVDMDQNVSPLTSSSGSGTNLRDSHVSRVAAEDETEYGGSNSHTHSPFLRNDDSVETSPRSTNEHRFIPLYPHRNILDLYESLVKRLRVMSHQESSPGLDPSEGLLDDQDEVHGGSHESLDSDRNSPASEDITDEPPPAYARVRSSPFVVNREDDVLQRNEDDSFMQESGDVNDASGSESNSQFGSVSHDRLQLQDSFHQMFLEAAILRIRNYRTDEKYESRFDPERRSRFTEARGIAEVLAMLLSPKNSYILNNFAGKNPCKFEDSLLALKVLTGISRPVPISNTHESILGDIYDFFHRTSNSCFDVLTDGLKYPFHGKISLDTALSSSDSEDALKLVSYGSLSKIIFSCPSIRDYLKKVSAYKFFVAQVGYPAFNEDDLFLLQKLSSSDSRRNIVESMTRRALLGGIDYFMNWYAMQPISYFNPLTMESLQPALREYINNNRLVGLERLKEFESYEKTVKMLWHRRRYEYPAITSEPVMTYRDMGKVCTNIDNMHEEDYQAYVKFLAFPKSNEFLLMGETVYQYVVGQANDVRASGCAYSAFTWKFVAAPEVFAWVISTEYMNENIGVLLTARKITADGVLLCLANTREHHTLQYIPVAYDVAYIALGLVERQDYAIDSMLNLTMKHSRISALSAQSSSPPVKHRKFLKNDTFIPLWTYAHSIQSSSHLYLEFSIPGLYMSHEIEKPLNAIFIQNVLERALLSVHNDPSGLRYMPYIASEFYVPSQYNALIVFPEFYMKKESIRKEDIVNRLKKSFVAGVLDSLPGLSVGLKETIKHVYMTGNEGSYKLPMQDIAPLLIYMDEPRNLYWNFNLLQSRSSAGFAVFHQPITTVNSANLTMFTPFSSLESPVSLTDDTFDVDCGPLDAFPRFSWEAIPNSQLGTVSVNLPAKDKWLKIPVYSPPPPLFYQQE